MGNRLSVALCVLVLGLAGCTQAPPPDPDVLRFSAIPDQPTRQVIQQHEALMNRLCATIRRSCRWVAAESYESLVERLGRGEVDVAYFGGVTFAQAHVRHGAVPLAMRDIDFRFTSVIVVRKDAQAHDLDGLKQVRFSFGNRSSTSGHLMARQRLLDQGVIPERYFASVAFTTDHDATLRAVASRDADAGCVNASVFYRRVAAGDPAAALLRVVWQTPPFTDYVWAGRRELSASLRQELIDAFLDLDTSTDTDRSALRAEGATGFVPAYASDFDEVRAVLRSQGLL